MPGTRPPQADRAATGQRRTGLAGVYHDSSYGFSIRPPAGWQVQEDPHLAAAVEFATDDDQGAVASLGVLVESSLGRSAPECAHDQSDAEQAYLSGYKRFEDRSTRLGAYLFHEQDYAYDRRPDDTDASYRARVIAWHLVNGETLFTLRFEARVATFERHLTSARASAATFRLAQSDVP